MLIRNIMLSNLRGIDTFSAQVKNNALILVGQNDAGKSTVLHALRLFLDVEKVTVEDFPKHDTSLDIGIQIDFEVDKFVELKHDGLLKLRKRYKLNEGKIITTNEIYVKPIFPSGEELDTYKTLKEVGLSLGIEFPVKKPSSEDIEQLKQQVVERIQESKDNYIWQNADSYWSNFKDIFPEVIFIPASQDHENEQKMTSDTSLFGKLFRVGIRKWLQVDGKSKEAIDVIQTKVEEINGQIIDLVEKRLKECVPFAQSLSQKLAPIDVSKGFSFSMNVKDDHGIETPLSQRGSGLQRSVLVAAIRAQCDVDKLITEIVEKQKEENGEEKESSYTTIHKTVLYLFEEPEVFLHLGAQKELFYALKDLANKSQVVITTHSTFFMDEGEMEDVVLLQRHNGKTSSLQHIPGEDIKDELGENIRISTLITGKVCCIVEGKSDKVAFEVWLRTLGYDPRKLGIHFIPMDGCNNVEYYANADILNDFNVPFIIILDTDSHSPRKSEKIKNYLETKYPRLRANNSIRILSGELENFFNIDIVSEVLKIPKEYINPDDYKIDPKKALEGAKDIAIAAGLSGVRSYNEVRDSRKIAAKMLKEELYRPHERFDILNTLVELAGEKITETIKH